MTENLPLISSEIKDICLICFESRSKSEFLKLECSHSFCKICVFRDWQSKIKSGYLDISSLRCPQDNCLTAISLLHLKNLLPNELYTRMEELCNINSQVLIPTEKSIRCPKCEIRFNIWKDADYFTCGQCKKSYCAKCSGGFEEHSGFTCDEFQETKGATEEEKAFYKQMKANGYRKCPNCFTFIEKCDGCNFIRCKSGMCAGKYCFCYLCGVKVDSKDHYNHYMESPWEGPCINTVLKEELTKPKENALDKKFIDDASCPACNKLCKIVRGIDEKGRFCLCESKECKGKDGLSKTYCRDCKKEVTDKNFEDHLSGACINTKCCIF